VGEGPGVRAEPTQVGFVIVDWGFIPVSAFMSFFSQIAGGLSASDRDCGVRGKERIRIGELERSKIRQAV
jgi:hypothetical protein